MAVEEINKKEDARIRDTIYEKIDVSVKTIDKFILALIIALATSIILGIVM